MRTAASATFQMSLLNTLVQTVILRCVPRIWATKGVELEVCALDLEMNDLECQKPMLAQSPASSFHHFKQTSRFVVSDCKTHCPPNALHSSQFASCEQTLTSTTSSSSTTLTTRRRCARRRSMRSIWGHNSTPRLYLGCFSIDQSLQQR